MAESGAGMEPEIIWGGTLGYTEARAVRSGCRNPGPPYSCTLVVEVRDKDGMGAPYWRQVARAERTAEPQAKLVEALLEICLSMPPLPSSGR